MIPAVMASFIDISFPVLGSITDLMMNRFCSSCVDEVNCSVVTASCLPDPKHRHGFIHALNSLNVNYVVRMNIHISLY